MAQVSKKQGTKRQLTRTRLTKTGYDFGFLLTVVVLLVLGL